MNLTCDLFLFYNCKELIYYCHVPGVVPLRYTPTSSISKIMVEFYGIDVPLCSPYARSVGIVTLQRSPVFM